MQSRDASCIRTTDESPCNGHSCCSCDRVFFCGEKHTCPPRPERVATGIVRRQTFTERLSDGFKMLDHD